MAQVMERVSRELRNAYKQGEACPLKSVCPVIKEDGECRVASGFECDPGSLSFESLGECHCGSEKCVGIAVVRVRKNGAEHEACHVCASILALV